MFLGLEKERGMHEKGAMPYLIFSARTLGVLEKLVQSSLDDADVELIGSPRRETDERGDKVWVQALLERKASVVPEDPVPVRARTFGGAA